LDLKFAPVRKPDQANFKSSALERLALSVIPALWAGRARFSGTVGMDILVSADWLATQLGASDLSIVDATFFLPDDGRDAPTEFAAAHIPRAVFLNLECLVDPDHHVPGMLPPPSMFAARMEELGISDTNRIVVYDNSPHHSAARAWWMLKTYGARQVAILDGGLTKWSAEGRPLESGSRIPRPGQFRAVLNSDWLADKDQVASIVNSPTNQIVDARSARRFAGEDPEPRPGIARGHIPGSRNLPQGQLFNPDNSFRKGEALRAVFEAAGVDLDKPLTTSCGSGITAAVLLFGAHLLGKRDVRLYDGSWAEWGADPATPKAMGPE
jgi:thiosulfate/3-mercaptopyruvate sulfurtransferase